MTERTSSTPDPSDFPVLRTATSRWSDNDWYGHLNNAVYYELFDSAINGWLLEQAPGDTPASTGAIGVVAESGCRYLRSLSFPSALVVGLRVERVGRSSVTYTLGLWAEGDPSVAAVGHWVHVYVATGAEGGSVPVPDGIRAVVESATR